MRPPVVLATDGDALARALPPSGWSRREGLHLPVAPHDLSARRWVCAAVVADRPTMRSAVEALERGVGLMVAITIEGEARLSFLEDIDRAGTVMAGDPRPVLEDDQRELLVLLADGMTVGLAAQAVGVSLRTANRRLAAARKRLGVTTTVEAVLHRDRCEDAAG